MPEARDLKKTGEISVTLATWIFLLDQKGVHAQHAGLRAACDMLRSAPGDADWDALGEALVAEVRNGLASSAPDAVAAWVASLYGAEHVASAFGESRNRLAHARTYQFRHGLPWLAVILDRFPGGRVGPHWVMVERVTDTVTCMDPYPWDEVNEEYAPLVEFLVKWELAGCTTLYWVP